MKKLSKNLPAKYYQDKKKETLQKKACESISEEEKPKKQQYVCERY